MKQIRQRPLLPLPFILSAALPIALAAQGKPEPRIPDHAVKAQPVASQMGQPKAPAPPPPPASVFPMTGDGDTDFGGGKHGRVHAVLDASGKLRATVETWTNSPFQGFTMGVEVWALDRARGMVYRLPGGPFGVDGINTPFGSAPRRTDVLVAQLDPADVANVSQVYAFVYYAPKTRIIDIATKIHTTVRDICKTYSSDNTYFSTGCKVAGF